MADITLISTADWDHPLWTNKQHVACALADLGQRVLYVESLGLRPIRVASSGARSDRQRVIRRLFKSLLLPRQVRPNLWVWSPLVLPGALKGPALWFNRFSLALGLAIAQVIVGLRREWLWTYNPITLSVISASGYSRVIYHCVDAIQAQPGMPVEHINLWEERLCRRADEVFVTSPKLLAQLRTFNAHTHFYPNVADQPHFGRAMDSDLSLPGDLLMIPGPRIGFAGAISAYKLDLELLAGLARRCPHWSFVLVGPVGEADPLTDVGELQCLANVHLLGQRSYASLPAYFKGFDLALLPLRYNAYTEAMFPMKFFEYLAAGLPVVASCVDALRPFSDLAHLVEPTAESFERAISLALAGSCPALEQRLAGAAQYTYRSRTESMLTDIAALS